MNANYFNETKKNTIIFVAKLSKMNEKNKINKKQNFPPANIKHETKSSNSNNPTNIKKKARNRTTIKTENILRMANKIKYIKQTPPSSFASHRFTQSLLFHVFGLVQNKRTHNKKNLYK